MLLLLLWLNTDTPLYPPSSRVPAHKTGPSSKEMFPNTTAGQFIISLTIIEPIVPIMANISTWSDLEEQISINAAAWCVGLFTSLRKMYWASAAINHHAQRPALFSLVEPFEFTAPVDSHSTRRAQAVPNTLTHDYFSLNYFPLVLISYSHHSPQSSALPGWTELNSGEVRSQGSSGSAGDR